MNCKILTSADYSAYTSFSLAQQENRILKPNNQSLENFYFNDEEPLFKVFAMYRHGKIDSCIFARFSEIERIWQIRYVISESIFSLISLFDFVIQYAENINYYRCYVGWFLHNSLCWEKILLRTTLFKRYIISTEDIIPALRKSSFYKYWFEFQEGVLSESELIVRTYSLDERYRDFKYGI